MEKDKKRPSHFTVSFNPEIPKHRSAMDLLNSLGRHKAYVIAEALDLYIRSGCWQRGTDHLTIREEETVLPADVQGAGMQEQEKHGMDRKEQNSRKAEKISEQGHMPSDMPEADGLDEEDIAAIMSGLNFLDSLSDEDE